MRKGKEEVDIEQVEVQADHRGLSPVASPYAGDPGGYGYTLAGVWILKRVPRYGGNHKALYKSTNFILAKKERKSNGGIVDVGKNL